MKFPGVIVCLLLSVPSSAPSPVRHLVEGVPFVRQERQYCGPACLAMVLGYYGVRVPQEDLAEGLYRRELSGSLNLDLLLAARRRGFDAEMHEGDLELIRHYLRQDIPVIALVRVSARPERYHYLVIFGYDDENQSLTVHSGNIRSGEIGYPEFGRDWEAAGNWMLTVERKKDWP